MARPVAVPRRERRPRRRPPPTARLAGLALLLGLLSPATADEPAAALPLSIEAVDGSLCFSREALEAEVRRALPAVELGAGAIARGGALVAVTRRGGAIDVEVRREGGRAEHHPVPLGSECRTLTETVASIITRAVVPLGYRPLPPLRRAVLPPVVVTVPAPPPLEPPAPNPPAPAIASRPAPPPPPLLQIDAAARLNLVLDGPGVTPGAGGLLTIAYRQRGFLGFVAGGGEQPFGYRSDSASQTLVRVPLMAGAGYELAVPGGGVRLCLAALLEVYLASLVEAGAPAGSAWAMAGLAAQLAYHYRPRRWLDVSLGLDFEQSLQGHRLTSRDGSVNVAVPTRWLSPRLGISINLF